MSTSPISSQISNKISSLKSDKGLRDNAFAIVTFTPAILFLVVLTVVPMAYAIMLSLQEATIFATSDPFVGLENYRKLYADPEFFTSIWLGVVFSIASVILQVVLGLGLALTLNKKFFGSSVALTVAILPYLIPTIAVALMWKWLLGPVFGIVNYYAISLGLISTSIEFFGSKDMAMSTLVLANSWKFTSFALLIFLARLQSIDSALYEQAKISGASTIQMFRSITLPNLRSAILLVLLMRTIWMFNKFDIIWMLTKGGPLGATTTLPVYIYRVAFNRFDLALGSAAALNLFLILTVFAVFYFWVFQPSREIETAR